MLAVYVSENYMLELHISLCRIVAVQGKKKILFHVVLQQRLWSG